MFKKLVTECSRGTQGSVMCVCACCEVLCANMLQSASTSPKQLSPAATEAVDGEQ